LRNAKAGERYQFERLGYFCVDDKETTADNLVFNRSVTLRDIWAKIEKSGNRLNSDFQRSHAKR
jgi:glutaminyl-tRNA synthetase